MKEAQMVLSFFKSHLLRFYMQAGYKERSESDNRHTKVEICFLSVVTLPHSVETRTAITVTTFALPTSQLLKKLGNTVTWELL